MNALVLIGAFLLLGSGKRSSSTTTPTTTPPKTEPQPKEVIEDVVTTTLDLIDRYTNWLKGK